MSSCQICGNSIQRSDYYKSGWYHTASEGTVTHDALPVQVNSSTSATKWKAFALVLLAVLAIIWFTRNDNTTPSTGCTVISNYDTGEESQC